MARNRDKHLPDNSSYGFIAANGRSPHQKIEQKGTRESEISSGVGQGSGLWFLILALL
jgi:hypothetical protein